MNTNALCTAVMTKLQTDAPLLVAAPGNVHLHFAPETTLEPFVIVSPQIERPVQEQSTAKPEAYRIGRFQVKAVAQATSGALVQTAMDRIDALLNNGTLTIAGYHFMLCQQVESFNLIERDGPLRWQHRGADYEVWADPL